MRWRIAISNVPDDKRLLRELVGALDVSIVEEGGEHFLSGELFEREQSANAVHKLATRLEGVASEVEQGDPDARCSITVGPVFEHLVDGSWRKNAFASIRACGGGRTTVSSVKMTVGTRPELSKEERLRLEQERREIEFQTLFQKIAPKFLSAFKCELSLQGQQLLRRELDPMTLGHIAEIIKDDVGDIRKIVSITQWGRFQGSINHPSVFGAKARHIVPKKIPPPNPMTLPEAQIFIRDVANRWMSQKAVCVPHWNK